MFKVVTFYEFKDMSEFGDLVSVRDELRAAMRSNDIKGTLILAAEGFNSTVAGLPNDVDIFVASAEIILRTSADRKVSFSDEIPFRRVDVKIKREIVTLGKRVDISLGKGTHVSSSEWNSLIEDPETVLLDARNGYEHNTGTFRGAINPKTNKFSELPNFVASDLGSGKHKKVAMFCTGGVRCEKLAPYLKERGFEEVYQLEGGILRYLEETDPQDSLWEGECFVFDSRISVAGDLTKGRSPDLSRDRQDRRRTR